MIFRDFRKIPYTGKQAGTGTSQDSGSKVQEITRGLKPAMISDKPTERGTQTQYTTEGSVMRDR